MENKPKEWWIEQTRMDSDLARRAPRDPNNNVIEYHVIEYFAYDIAIRDRDANFEAAAKWKEVALENQSRADDAEVEHDEACAARDQWRQTKIELNAERSKSEKLVEERDHYKYLYQEATGRLGE